MQTKGSWLWTGLVVVVAGLLVMPSGAQDKPALESHKDKLSYSIGVEVAKNLKRLSVEVDPDIIGRAVRDVLEDKKLALSDDDLRRILTGHQTDMRQRQAKLMKAQAEEKQKEANAFLESNKGKEGIVSLPSGLQYKVLTVGVGPKPAETNTVEIRYRGTFVNGTEFESSEKLYGKPTTQKVASTLPGWREALKLMPAGSKWQLFVPPQLSGNPRAATRDPGASAVLVYELELISIR